MKVLSSRFRNEKGEDIYVRITDESLAGTPGLLIYMAGPDSDTEMHITREEGRELLGVLSKFFRAR